MRSIRNNQSTSMVFQYEKSAGHKFDFNTCKRIDNMEHHKSSEKSRGNAFHLRAVWKTIIQKEM